MSLRGASQRGASQRGASQRGRLLRETYTGAPPARRAEEHRSEHKIRVTGAKTTGGQGATLPHAVSLGGAPKDPVDGRGEVGGIPDQAFSFGCGEPVLSVTYDGGAIMKGTDYTLSCGDEWELGTATAIVGGCGRREGRLGSCR